MCCHDRATSWPLNCALEAGLGPGSETQKQTRNCRHDTACLTQRICMAWGAHARLTEPWMPTRTHKSASAGARTHARMHESMHNSTSLVTSASTAQRPLAAGTAQRLHRTHPGAFLDVKELVLAHRVAAGALLIVCAQAEPARSPAATAQQAAQDERLTQTYSGGPAASARKSAPWRTNCRAVRWRGGCTGTQKCA